MDRLPQELIEKIFFLCGPKSVYCSLLPVCSKFQAIARSLVDGQQRLPIAASVTFRRPTHRGSVAPEPFAIAENFKILPSFQRTGFGWFLGHADATLSLMAFNDGRDMEGMDSLLRHAVSVQLGVPESRVKLQVVRISVPPFTASRMPLSVFAKTMAFISHSKPERLDLSADFSSRWHESKPLPLASVCTLGNSGMVPPVLDATGGVGYDNLLVHFPNTCFFDLNGGWGDYRYFRHVMGAMQLSGVERRIKKVRIIDNHSTPPFKPYVLPQFLPALEDLGFLPLAASLPTILQHSTFLFTKPFPSIQVLRFYVDLSSLEFKVAAKAAKKFRAIFPNTTVLWFHLDVEDWAKLDEPDVLVEGWLSMLDALPAEVVHVVEANPWPQQVCDFVADLVQVSKTQETAFDHTHPKLRVWRVGEREEDCKPWTVPRGDRSHVSNDN
ncbi:hypothetical protein M427DRAFT_52179 [Gonapodya prolifera JEL478]|uniref:F-box domain-containing protein n=1 Tax=Gonapodya prolifera (strain JEL478) TaxID=1344416 RepID=A0A139AVT4_GONPJ|nr:hypothetical protein M427DRAFT_52179 [Gonapodya prolifera JEL478]|eukprot:KXS20585.1 hypothetical protein M427DRAFT_52179 [Gonapodya prolifera JEL478]